MKRKTLIISDLHLGTPDAHDQKLLKFLEKHPCKTLIINGDLIDKRYLRFFGKRKAEHETVLSKIKQICKKNQTKIFYLKGNHERDKHTISSTLGEPQQEITITSHGKKYIVCHGDSFEKEMRNPNAFTLTLSFIGYFVARIDRNLHTKYRISHFLESIYGFFTNQKTRFLKNAITHAKRKKADGIICGHIHQEAIKMIDGVHYLNSGNRTETCSALAEDEKGKRKILYA